LKNKIKRNGICIKTCVLIWIVLPVLLLFISISLTEASKSTAIQKNTEIYSKHKSDSENSLASQDNTGINLDQKSEDNKGAEKSDIGSFNLDKKISENFDKKSPKIELINQKVKIGADINTHRQKSTVLTSDHETGEDSNDIKSSDQDKLSLDQKSEDNNGAEKSESGSFNLEEKKSENSNKKSPRNEVLIQKINTGADINTDSPKSTVLTSNHETGEDGNDIKSSDQNELSLEQKITVKGGTDATESTGLCLKQKTGVDTSKETICSINQEVKAEPKTGIEIRNKVKSQKSEREKPIPKKNGTTSAKNKVPSGRDRKEQSSSTITTPQKTDTILDSSSINSGFDSSSMNSGFDSSSKNSGFDSSGMNSGSDSSSTDHGDSSRITSSSMLSINNKVLSNPVSERPVMEIVYIPGIANLQPDIKRQIVQATIIKPPSKMVSFLIGFAGMLFIVSTIMRVRN